MHRICPLSRALASAVIKGPLLHGPTVETYCCKIEQWPHWSSGGTRRMQVNFWYIGGPAHALLLPSYARECLDARLITSVPMNSYLSLRFVSPTI